MEHTMTKNLYEIKARKAEENIAQAVAGFEEGFASKAAKQRCLESLNRAYDYIRDLEFSDLIDQAPEVGPERQAFFDSKVDAPFDLHHVREKHAPAFPARWERVQELVELRTQVKAADITPPQPKQSVARDALEARVTESLEQLMERRKAQFIRGCELHDIFGGLPVSVHAHYVTNQFGTTFIRRFYFMNGKLTPLNMILAIMETKAREKEEG